MSGAQASLVRAETDFELAELQMADVRIRAPMTGTLIQKNVEEGAVIQSASSNVSGGTALFVMADLGDMQVRTLVDETDMGELKAGMQTSVRVEAFPDRTFQGIVEKIEPQAQVEQNVSSTSTVSPSRAKSVQVRSRPCVAPAVRNSVLGSTDIP